ncbi:DoxX family protein [Flavobacterium plurextorum]|uniref:DoxX family protein n=1 Tax=Flavobacterium plurextorum TaxID=1114867 RepID=UPI003756924A
MEISAARKNLIVYIICLLYILLFVYAGVSKLLEFENFQIQIGQSPLLSAFAGPISWIVIFLEFLISALLSLERFRRIGLYLGFVLMVLFSVYIFFIMNFASFVPCSCGGVLEDMNWQQHFLFNLLFVILGAIGLLLWRNEKVALSLTIKQLLFSTFASILCVTSLFLLSESNMHSRNNFIRRFPSDPEIKPNMIDLGFNSYYFAGITDTIYLGNTSAPRHVLLISQNLKSKTSVLIDADAGNVNLRAPQLRVLPPKFFIFDGASSCIFKGKIADWKAYNPEVLDFQFTLAEPVGMSTFIYRGWHPKTKENVLGIMNLSLGKSNIKPDLLEKQVDGIFDTDGILTTGNNSAYYIYYYRNEIIQFNTELQLTKRFTTIDTLSKARIQVGHISSQKTTKLSAPPIVVNRLVAIDGNNLFVNSPRIGRYEDDEIWQHADVVDIYDIPTGTYLSSFYVYRQKGKGLSAFRVRNGTFFGLTGNLLISYKLDKKLFEKK